MDSTTITEADDEQRRCDLGVFIVRGDLATGMDFVGDGASRSGRLTFGRRFAVGQLLFDEVADPRLAPLRFGRFELGHDDAPEFVANHGAR